MLLANSFANLVLNIWTFVILTFMFTFIIILAPQLRDYSLSFLARLKRKFKKSDVKENKETGLEEIIKAAG
ncbi:hypothetical protein [Alkaliphilus serpentinus]|uniref:Uncharacterized protein n=1 Tax=Alkaliphilus serpentinus TaxID=1482731 RepID=A0A833HLN7_9FIRM|nr:hypothetical protein [Alkaliphilus serpentinus]KAB3526245.1 hypothetical protein F8153_14165 [Alkaliphilus serpentinus]